MPASIETADIFAEWTPRRSWKERKKAMKERNGSHLVPADAEPELMFYGKRSGVVGLSKSELFQTGCSSVAGYDKVCCLDPFQNGYLIELYLLSTVTIGMCLMEIIFDRIDLSEGTRLWKNCYVSNPWICKDS